MKEFKISHEYRVAYLEEMPDSCLHLTNNHIIPANENVRRAFDIIKKDNMIYIEGFLVNWRGFGEYSGAIFETALYKNQVSHERFGGSMTFLCRQIYLTKVIYNGFVYE